MNILTGVPQGAVISPLLFSIFINDIPRLEKKNNSYSSLFVFLVIFLGTNFDEHLCFNSQIEFIRSRCQDRVNVIKIISHKSWKLLNKTLLGVYNALIGSIIDYSFFTISSASKTNVHKLQVIQNICIKSIYNLPYDTPSEIFFNFLDELGIDTIETRLKRLLTRYVKNSIQYKNQLMLDLIKDYVEVFIESSRELESKSPLSLFSDELPQWMIQFL